VPPDDRGDALGAHAVQVQVYLLRALDRGTSRMGECMRPGSLAGRRDPAAVNAWNGAPVAAHPPGNRGFPADPPDSG
jgi:hypothetical protein